MSMTDIRVTVVHLKSKVLSSPSEVHFFIFGEGGKYPTQGRQGQANFWILQAISSAGSHGLHYRQFSCDELIL